jgi:hypothetical protein
MKEFQTLGGIDPNSCILDESCSISFAIFLRWFYSTLKSKEPLKINSADSIHLDYFLGGWIFNLFQ